MTHPSPVVGVDPGGRQTGVVARTGSRPLFACTITREGAEVTPAGAYVAEVIAAVTDALAVFDDTGPVLVAVEGVVQPTGHVRMVNIAGILGTAIVLGAVLAAYPGAVVVPPGGHGSGPLDSYPASLRGPRELAGRGKYRHVRSAYDVAGTGLVLAGFNRPPSGAELLGADVPTRPERGDPMSPKQKLAKDRRHGEKRMGQPRPIPDKNNPQPRRETK